MTDLERSILIGVVIGDGCITSQRRSLKVTHSTKQRIYLEYKKELVSKILNKTINTLECTHKHYTGNIYYTCSFNISHPFYTEAFDWIYPNGIKTITKILLDTLTPQSIALWYMDDGSGDIKRNIKGMPTSCQTHIALYTSKDQAQLVADYFLNKYNIKMSIRSTGNKKAEQYKYSVYMNTENSKKFIALIKPFIIPSMEYKLKHIETTEVLKETGLCKCGNPLFTTRLVNSSVLCKTCRNRLSNIQQGIRRKSMQTKTDSIK